MKSNRITRHQEIYKRTKNGLELVLPKKITTDIGFQLMFGYRENYRLEQEKIQNIKGLAQAMVQNGLPASAMAEMFDTESFPQLKAKLREAEKATEQLQQAQQQAEQEAAAQQQQAQMEAEQAKVENENQNKELDRQNRIDIAMIQAQGTRGAQELDLAKSMREHESRNAEIDTKNRSIDEDIRSNRANESIEREKIAQDAANKRAEVNVKEKQQRSKDNGAG